MATVSFVFAAVLAGRWLALIGTSAGAFVEPETSSSGSEPCYLDCLGRLETSGGTIWVGIDPDEGAANGERYLSTWTVHGGDTSRTVLTRKGDYTLRFIAPLGDGAAIIASELAGSVYTAWTTTDGTSWVGPTRFVLPGWNGAFPHSSVPWGSGLIVTGDRFIDGGYRASVWTSPNLIDWRLASTPPEFNDKIVTRTWLGGDGVVVGISPPAAASEWPWTTSDLVHWRPMASAYPCEWMVGRLPPYHECVQR